MSKKVKVDDFKQLMRDMFGDRYIDAGGINDPIMHNNKKILTESLNKNLRMTDKEKFEHWWDNNKAIRVRLFHTCFMQFHFINEIFIMQANIKMHYN